MKPLCLPKEVDSPSWSPADDHLYLDWLGTQIISTKLAIEQSREVIRQTQDAIAGIERWSARQK